jgi:peptidoglycan/LPS O-acetylase OafA/YrhL
VPARRRGTRRTAFDLGYRPALDGVRAVAVLGVMFFHATLVPNAPFHVSGGFFGVDIFFVLSGFLITTLLVEEYQRASRISLRAFYARRALRLLPALVVVLLAVLLYAQVDLAGGVGHFVRVEAIWTALYGLNWYFVVQHNPLLTLLHLGHAWSLSIEEQFYLVWPLLLIGLLRLRLSGRALVAITLTGAAASALVMVAVAPRGLAGEFHALYGTDARAQGFLIGAALGLAAVHGMLPVRLGGRTALAVAGWAAAALLALAFAGVVGSRSGAFLEDGGYTLVAAAAVVVIAHLVVNSGDVMARALAWRPARAVGRISYGLYLWHLPIFLVLDEDRTGLSFWPRVVLQFGVTFAAASLSYVAVERPALRLKRRFERVRTPADSREGREPGVTVRP